MLLHGIKVDVTRQHIQLEFLSGQQPQAETEKKRENIPISHNFGRHCAACHALFYVIFHFLFSILFLSL